MADMIIWFVLTLMFSAIACRIGFINGRSAGRKQGWDERERYGNGGRRQWQNRPPGRVKGSPRGYWWNYR
jgi:hypothetical protein